MERAWEHIIFLVSKFGPGRFSCPVPEVERGSQRLESITRQRASSSRPSLGLGDHRHALRPREETGRPTRGGGRLSLTARYCTAFAHPLSQNRLPRDLGGYQPLSTIESQNLGLSFFATPLLAHVSPAVRYSSPPHVQRTPPDGSCHFHSTNHQQVFAFSFLTSYFDILHGNRIASR